MSESSNLNESFQLFFPSDYSSAIEIEQLSIHSERNLSLSAETINSKSTEQLSLKNVTNVVKSNKTVKDCESFAKKLEYPLTKWSKREMAAKIRAERDRKFESIKKINEKITRGAEFLKNTSGKTQADKLEDLKKLNNGQLYHDRSSINDDMQSTSLNTRIEALELNLRKIQDELIVEKNRLSDDVEEHLNVVEDQYFNNESDEKSIYTNIETINEQVEKDRSDKTESALDDVTKRMDDCSLNELVFETVSNLETRLTFNPNPIEFKVMKRYSNEIIDSSILEQQIKVTNRSKTTVSCKFSHLSDPNWVLQDNMNTIKVIPVTWCRVQPATTIVYSVTFKPMVLPNFRTYQSLYGVKLVFETVTNNQPDLKYVLSIPVKFCIIKPEPELVTKTITFPAVRDSCENYISKQYLIMKNNGDADCVFSVLTETEFQKKRNISFFLGYDLNETEMDDNDVIPGTIIKYVIRQMFSNFMWRHHVNVLLPAKRSVKVPVIFNRNFAQSSVTEYFIIVFDNTEYSIPNQRVNVIGQVIDQQILVDPSVIDLGLCYLTSSVQTGSFKLRNTSRVVVPYEIKLPRELSKHAGLSHSKGYLKAGSSMEIFIRLCLKYDMLRPDECKTYFDAKSGVLDFPVRVYPSNCKKFHEIRVLAVVTTSFGLKLSPDTLDFGTVNTTETVVRSVMLANHSRTKMEYGFMKLPERISVRPSAFGTIFSGEKICLHLHYSPGTSILQQNVHTYNDDFVLICDTVTGANADICPFQNDATSQIYETINEENMSNTIINKNPAVSENEIKELNHGPDQIDVSVLKHEVEISSFEKNAILRQATVRCLAQIHDVPVELSIQKIIFGKTHFTSYSIFKIDLRASNLASITERNINSFPDFKIRFEFVSNDSTVEFKPRNGLLHSKEIMTISVIFRPQLDSEMQSIYEESLNSEVIKIKVDKILKDKNSFINQVYTDKPFLHEKIKVFEANKIFYSLMYDTTKIVSAACFVQFVNQKSKEYFGFCTESLKLSLVCPTTKPNIILFSDRIDFGERTIDVRHNEWLFVRNVTTRPVPLKVSPPSPVGPFFCAFALNGEQLLYPDRTLPINISFIPEHELEVKEMLEVSSETMRLQVMVSGSGLGPSCTITPNDMFNVIQSTRKHANKALIFRVTNTSGTKVRFNVQMEWTRERSEPMVDSAVFEFIETLRTAELSDPEQRAAMESRFEGADWAEESADAGEGAFDLGNGGRPLWFRLDPNGSRYVQVTLMLPRYNRQLDEDKDGVSDEESLESPDGSEEEAFKSPDDGFGTKLAEPGREHNRNNDDRTATDKRRVFAAKFNVHVGHLVLQQFYVFGFVDVDKSADS
ncbi:uncharacterized protein LOC111037460 [Myzus persicae]|uniref:uncharacterized protein LOC111037460 n=1 Tax=Myzus persicae TaxID=13164 RepID=UPI000B930C12|nr:uncharacterized protein LOC111037460 [Myzus persicae]